MRSKEEILKEIENAKHSFEFNTKFHTECLEKLQKELEELKKPKRWKPDLFDKYYYIDSIGNIHKDMFINTTDTHQYRYKTRNCFKTKEEAEEELERILFVNEVRDFIEEENDGVEIIFDETLQKKYRLCYDFDRSSFFKAGNQCSKETSDYKYFLNESTYEKILSKFDNQKLIKWWI